MTTKLDINSNNTSEVRNGSKRLNESMNESSVHQSANERTGYEASDIIEDALQLAVDDELKEDREDITNDDNSSKVNIISSQNEVKSHKYNEDEAQEDEMPLNSPPKPETAPVVAPLTIEDKINMDTSKQRDSATDDASLIVNIDDTQSDLLDGDLDISTSTSVDNNNEVKQSNRKSINDAINSNESKCDFTNDNNTTNTEDSNNSSAKELNKVSEKDSSKSKSLNTQKESKLKIKESKNVTGGQKTSQNNSNGRNIWVSGLPQNTKASELQTLFSKHGKVVSAKIIKNARMSGSRCYGFITMENMEQVTKCISQLNKTELHSRTILLSRNRPQESFSKTVVSRSKPNATKREIVKKSSNKANDSNKELVKEIDNKDIKSDEKSDENIKTKSPEEKHQNRTNSETDSNKGSDLKEREKRKPIRPPIRDRVVPFRRPIIPFRRPIPLRRPFPQNNPNMRGFRRNPLSRGGMSMGMGMGRPPLIKRLDVERHIRERERERQIREERRRREELMRVERDIEREERIRFEREKERLKLERMKLEREKVEFFKYERERAKLEREKIESEREELRRRQQTQPVIPHRVEESRSRSAIITPINKRQFETRDIRGSDPYWEDRKRFQQMQRIDNHMLPSRQTYEISSPAAGNRHISHSYENRNESYNKRTRIELLPGSSRSEFDSRRHESRHGIGHDRDERKSGGTPSGSYYRGDSRNPSFAARDRRMGSQRDEWKPSHESRRSDRYADKPLSGGSAGFGGTSRYAGDSRNWTDRTPNSLSKISYGSGNVHMSGGQQWNPSSGDRWNSAISSSEARGRNQQSMNSTMISGTNPSIADLFGPNPMPGMSLNISHSLGGGSGNNSMGSGERSYMHSNRRF